MKKKLFTVLIISVFITVVMWVLGVTEIFYRFNITMFEKVYSFFLSFL